MRVYRPYLLLLAFFISTLLSQAYAEHVSHRIPQLSNKKVTVWETIIYPSTKQSLKMHRHYHDRVLVALSDGTLKITNGVGRVHYLKLEKDKSYYLTKDLPNELHKDENTGNHPIKVIVVELKNIE